MKIAPGGVLREYEGAGESGYILDCPGCGQWHMIRVTGPEPRWTFSGDTANPSFSPSVRVRGTEAGRQTQCHFFVENRQIRFCGDSMHALSGQTVPMKLWEEEK